MMEPNSFTSEPQYQRPDQRNSDIDYIRRPEPIIVGAPVSPVVAPVPVAPVVPVDEFAYDGTFGKRLLDKFGRDILVWNQLDFYGNTIPLGSFCYALAFIIYGFYRCKVYKVNDTFLWAVILFFGGIGQVTAGFLEWCKGRAFPTAIYLTYVIMPSILFLHGLQSITIYQCFTISEKILYALFIPDGLSFHLLFF